MLLFNVSSIPRSLLFGLNQYLILRVLLFFLVDAFVYLSFLCSWQRGHISMNSMKD